MSQCPFCNDLLSAFDVSHVCSSGKYAPKIPKRTINGYLITESDTRVTARPITDAEKTAIEAAIVFDVGIDKGNAVHQVSQGSVYTNIRGEYLIVRERVTHTGSHLHTEFTTDINEATIIDIHGLTIPYKHRYMLEALTPHSAVSVVTRQVKLVNKNGN